MTIEAIQRAAVVAEARKWLRTSYHHMGRVMRSGRDKGGVDCAMLLAEVYERAGIIGHVDVSFYPRDWHLHAKDEAEAGRFLSYILPLAVQIAGPPKPGDVVTFHIGKGFAHAGIVVDPGWPMIIHSDMDAGCVSLGDGTEGRHAWQNDGKRRPVRFFTLWPDAAA